MIRRARTRSSVSRLSAWLAVAAGLVVYAALVLWLASMRSWPDLSLPWWIAQALPPIVYGGLVFVFVRGVTSPQLVTATLVLWGVHMVVGMVTGLVVMRVDPAASAAPVAAFPPPPLPQLLWVPLLLLPLRDVISGAQHRRALSRGKVRERGGAVDVRTPVALAKPAGKVSLAPAIPPLPEAEQAIKSQPRETDVGPPVAEIGKPIGARTTAVEPAVPSPVPVLTDAEPPPIQPLAEDMLSEETSTDVVRVSFERVAAQLPAGAFQLPTDRIAAGLLEPGHLLIPLRLVVAQLAEGLVRTSWKVVREQFPRHLLAMTDEEIVRQLPDGQVVLPLDELVPQLPMDIFAFTLPAVDVGALESFPAPFQPAFSEEIDDGPPPAPSVEIPVAPVGEPATELSSTTTEWRLENDRPMEEGGACRADVPALPALDDAEFGQGVTGVAVQAPDSGLSTKAESDPPCTDVGREEPPVDTAPEPVAVAVAEALAEVAWRPPVPAAHELSEVVPLSGGVVPTAPSPALLLQPVATLSDLPPTSDELAATGRVAAVLASFRTLDVHIESVDGMKLFVASSPGSETGPVVGAARPLVPLLTDGRTPWAVDQMTLRGSGAALIMTPLGAVGRRGPVLVSAVPVGAPLALIEVLALRAAAECAVPTTTPAADQVRPHDEHQESDLIDTEAPTRIRQIAATLGALGPVAASALRDPEAERDLYVFLPSGTDARMVGSFASELDGAMRKAGEAAGAMFNTAVLRCGKRRLIIRCENSDNERASILVAGGETERPGLAYRQVESVALALDAR